jgi:hypothetical protein
MPGLTTDDLNLPDESQWIGQFDLSSSSGLICKRCHSLVPRMGAHPQQHFEWCKAVDDVVGRVRGGR